LIKWRGTTYRFHPLFSLMMIGSMVTGFFLEAITLFGIVLIHELGHVVAAKGFGWRVTKVELMPFGGVAVVEELGTVPAHEELIVALSGPLQHIWMIGFALLCKLAAGENQVWWDYFIEANLWIACFNLLPVLPLDGGKVMQCMLSYWIPYHRAIVYGVWISIVISILVIGVSIFQLLEGHLPLNLLVIGIFLFLSNWVAFRQLPYHFYRFLMSRDGRVSRFIVSGALAQPIVVTKHRGIVDVLKLLMRERYHLIYVVNDKGRIQAVLPEQQVVAGYLKGMKPGSVVSDFLK
jgi:stage IV sporulation protein FB